MFSSCLRHFLTWKPLEGRLLPCYFSIIKLSFLFKLCDLKWFCNFLAPGIFKIKMYLSRCSMLSLSFVVNIFNFLVGRRWTEGCCVIGVCKQTRSTERDERIGSYWETESSPSETTRKCLHCACFLHCLEEYVCFLILVMLFVRTIFIFC